MDTPGLVAVTAECEAKGLAAWPVVSYWQVDLLRLVRNATAWGFSEDTSGSITLDEQRAWWSGMHGHVAAWLYVLATVSARPQKDWPGDIVGFGVLRQTEDGRWWTSVGVLDRHAGHGYGGAITADVLRRSPEVCWATARVDNVAAQRLHRPADWEEIGRDERLVHFRSRAHVHPHNARAEWGAYGWLV